MTYNVFSGTLNPTHFTSLLGRAGVGLLYSLSMLWWQWPPLSPDPVWWGSD